MFCNDNINFETAFTNEFHNFGDNFIFNIFLDSKYNMMPGYDGLNYYERKIYHRTLRYYIRKEIPDPKKRNELFYKIVSDK